MTGQELIKKIEKENLQDRHLFIDVEGYISPVCEVLETKSGDIILTQEGRGIDDLYDKDNLERYFSEWFKIIPKEEAERKWFLRELDFYVLRRDGSDCLQTVNFKRRFRLLGFIMPRKLTGMK